MPIAIRPLLMALCIAGLAPPAAALVIDNFEEGDFTVSASNLTDTVVFGEQSGLLDSNVVGGVRLVRVAMGGTVGTATASLTTTVADDGVSVSYAGANGQADFSFSYDGIADGVDNGIGGNLNLDLSAFDFLAVNVTGSVPSTLQLTLWSSTTQKIGSLVTMAEGDNLFDLAQFALDLSDIQALRVRVFAIDPLEAPIINSITAIVPEPGTALLLAAGLVGLGARRRAARKETDS